MSLAHDITDAPLKRQGLFPCDSEIARRLSMSEQKFRSIVEALERRGFPKRDPIMGARYWPAVRRFWDKRYGLATVDASTFEDGEENIDALG